MDLHGLSQENYSYILKTIENILKNKYQSNIKIFGSRSRSDYKQYSDLDLWIECSPALTSHELQNLRDEFEESDLPIKIDIVTPETVLKDYLPSIKRELKEF